jgi:hypothetical protein
MVLTAVAVIGRLKRGFRRFGLVRFYLCHRMMAMHRRLRRMTGHGLAHAVHALRQGSTRQCHRPKDGGEHNQQQKSRGPA